MRCPECGLESGKLMDMRALQEELGVKRAVAERIMRSLRKVCIGRRVFVKRRDVEELLNG